ncbi:MAG TPA: Arm DNA-binding domain-containing protein, partial [Flavobacterium sp.]
MNILPCVDDYCKLIINLKVTKMKTRITVLFYLRKSKVNAQGQMPIYQRVTIDGQRFDLSTGLYIEEVK